MWSTGQRNAHVQLGGTAGTSIHTLGAAAFSSLPFLLSLEKSRHLPVVLMLWGAKWSWTSQGNTPFSVSRSRWGRNHCHRKGATPHSEPSPTQLGRLCGLEHQSQFLGTDKGRQITITVTACPAPYLDKLEWTDWLQIGLLNPGSTTGPPLMPLHEYVTFIH